MRIAPVDTSTNTPNKDALLLYLRGRALSGVPISTVEAWDLADVFEHGASRQSHQAVAEALDLSFSQVQRRRAVYGSPRLKGDPDQPLLCRASGAGRRPTCITLDDEADAGLQALLGAQEAAVEAGSSRMATGYEHDEEQDMRRLMAERFARMVARGCAPEEAERDILLDAERGDYGAWFAASVDNPVEYSVENLRAPFFGYARAADAPRARQSSPLPTEASSPVLQPQGVQGEPEGSPAATPDAREGGEADELSSPRSGSSASAATTESQPIGSAEPDRRPAAQELPGDAGDRPHQGTEVGRFPDRAWDSAGGVGGLRTPKVRIRTTRQAAGGRRGRRQLHRELKRTRYALRPAPAGSADRLEDEAQARTLRSALRSLKLLQRKAVAPVAHLADAIGTLRELYASRDAATRLLHAALCSLPRGGSAGGGSGGAGGGRGFPGYAFFLAERPRLACRSLWWLEGVEKGWNGAGTWSHMPGWSPITEPGPELTLYPADRMGPVDVYARWLAGAEDRAKAEAAEAAERRDAELAQLWADRDSAPGNLTLYSALADRLPWDAVIVLEGFGSNFGASIRRWQAAARGGSERCLLLLQRLDLLVKRDRRWARDRGADEALEALMEQIEAAHERDRLEAEAILGADS